MVRPGQTGWLAEEISPQAFARALEVALGELNHGLDLRGSCRALAEDEYGSDLQAQRYLQLFKSLYLPCEMEATAKSGSWNTVSYQ